jgi:multidrug efflux system outer membrane protein
MRRWIAAAILVLAPLYAGAAPGVRSPDGVPSASAPETPLTLAQAIARALATSPRLDEARAGVAAARAGRRGARAEGLPNLQGTVTERLQRPASRIVIGPFTVPSVTPGAPPQEIRRELKPTAPSRLLEEELFVLQAIDLSGRIRAQTRAAGRAERAALARADAEAQRLVFDVTMAYLNTLEARQQTVLTGALRELGEERLQVARVRLTAGAGIPLEVSQVEADLAQAVQREIEAESRDKQAGATLNTLIGRPAASPLVLTNLPATEPRHPLLMPGTAPPSPEQLRALGLERPELRAFREEVRRAEAEVGAARAARWPQISLRGSLIKRVPATLAGGFVRSLSGSLVQSLFDSGRTRARVESARAARARSAADLAEAERLVDAEVESARVTLDAAEKRLAAEEQRVAATAAAVEVARQRQRAGTAAPIEVTEAQTTLTRAQTDGLTAQFEAARARVRLAFVTGLAYPETVPALAVASTGQQ